MTDHPTAPSSAEVRAVAIDPPVDPAASVGDAGEHLVRPLGIVAVDVNQTLQQTLRLRQPGGVVVVARTLDSRGLNVGLLPGDVIRAVNRTEIWSVEGLRRALDQTSTAPLVLRIERAGRCRYVAVDLE